METAVRLCIDPEFAAISPAHSADELTQLLASLRKEGCLDALRVWQGYNILLDGHTRYRYCLAHGWTSRVEEVALADRAAARAWIVEIQAGRRNLGAEAVSYLRGARYHLDKQARGGDRRGARSKCHGDTLIDVAERLAEMFGVSCRTITRDARFATAVDTLVGCHEGPAEVRRVLLARDSGLTRHAVRRLAAKGLDEQKRVLDELMKTGKLPRKARNSVPLTAQAIAASFAKRLRGWEPAEAAATLRAVADLLGLALSDEDPPQEETEHRLSPKRGVK